MPTHRVDKVAAQLQVEISDVLARRLRDPRVGLISVLGVELSPDLRVARVRVSTLGGDEDHAELMEVLEHARGFIRHELAGSLRNAAPDSPRSASSTTATPSTPSASRRSSIRSTMRRPAMAPESAGDPPPG